MVLNKGSRNSSSLEFNNEGLVEAFQIYNAKKQLPGGVLTVSRHGSMCFADCFGVKDIDRPTEAMTMDTIFSIASMTKTVTSVAAMILFDRGLLGIDDPVSKYFPGFDKSDMRVIIKAGSTIAGDGPETCACKNTMTVVMYHYRLLAIFCLEC